MQRFRAGCLGESSRVVEQSTEQGIPGVVRMRVGLSPCHAGPSLSLGRPPRHGVGESAPLLAPADEADDCRR